MTDNPFATVASLPGQMDALAAGAFIATIEGLRSARHFARWGAMSFVSGTVLVAALISATGPASFSDPARWAIIPANVLVFSAMAILFAGLTAVVLAFENPVARVLSLRPLAHIGVVSYGLYLYSPLSLFLVSAVVDPEHPTEAYRRGGGVGFAIAVVAVNYLMALASWRYLEKPALQLRRRLAPGS